MKQLSKHYSKQKIKKMEIQGISFGKEKVIVSVGFFYVHELERLLQNNKSCYVEAYEPRDRIYKQYQAISKKFSARFVSIKKAVGGKDGKGSLLLRSTRSTLCFDTTKIYRGPYKKEASKVVVVSMESILKSVLGRFKKIDKLLLNCEGSEVSIIMNTPLKLLSRCKFVFVQFHDFIDDLNTTEKQRIECIERLETNFDVYVSKKKYARYEFTRRGI